ncbi:hypothetical protein [Micromonospora sp. NPDC093277]|uniref:hypothetical protein n=1 Tax=Micromonospora sp. NPDC093277 TaxID=3364291 RepID=UPI00380DFD7A
MSSGVQQNPMPGVSREEHRTAARLFLGLVRATARLALPAEVQLDYLRKIGAKIGGVGNVDELALEFDHVFGLLAEFEEMGWLTDVEAAVLREIDSRLTRMSDSRSDRVWSCEALHDDPSWSEVRFLAAQFLTKADFAGGVE